MKKTEKNRDHLRGKGRIHGIEKQRNGKKKMEVRKKEEERKET